MTIIPEVFYETKRKPSIVAPIIDPEEEIIGRQEKIHPFDYERDNVKPGNEGKIFNTLCKFGVIICHDMVFPKVANILTKKGAQVLFSPSRIVRRGISPWQMYVQVRALENRIPILAANVENHRFGRNSMIVDLIENNIVTTKITELSGEGKVIRFTLNKYEESRKRANFQI
ncbi:MAG: carbon-nitrogen hydrolase family protein [Nitrosopumilus sp.]